MGFLALGTSLCFPFFIRGALESKGLCGVFIWLKRWPFFLDVASLERTGTAPTAIQWGHRPQGGLPARIRGYPCHPTRPTTVLILIKLSLRRSSKWQWLSCSLNVLGEESQKNHQLIQEEPFSYPYNETCCFSVQSTNVWTHFFTEDISGSLDLQWSFWVSLSPPLSVDTTFAEVSYWLPYA